MITPIDITKCLFSSVDGSELPQSGYATDFRNLLKNDANSDVDRPALSTFASISAYPVEGLFYFKPADRVVAVTTDRQVWSIDQAGSVISLIGVQLEGTNRPVFASDGSYLAIAGGGTPLRWAGTGVTEDLAGSPPDTTHISYLDGYWILHLTDDQEFRWAGPTSVSREVWSSANFFAAEGLPDNVKAQEVLLRELYAFGENSTEIFQNFGSASTPFRRTFFLESGIVAPYSLIKADNTLFWLDHNRDFVRMEGRTPVIKSQAIAREVKRLTTVDDCFASKIEIEGHYLIVWTFPTEQISYAYDYRRSEWGMWDTFVDGESDRLDINSYVYIPEWNRHLVGSAASGAIYSLSFDNKTDNSNVFRRTRTMQYDHGTSSRKRSNYYLFHIKKNVATATTTNPVFQVRVNDDNKGWSAPQLVPMGILGGDHTPVRVRLGGIYRKRQLEITCTDPVAFGLIRIEEDIEAMSS